MTYHLLNGDALAQKLPRSVLGESIVCREVLMEGPVSRLGLSSFWEARAAFLAAHYGANPADYRQRVQAELERLLAIPAEAQVYAWFGEDLFCQVNLWWCLWLLHTHGHRPGCWRVFAPLEPVSARWAEFGPLDGEDLTHAYRHAYRLSEADVQLACHLWEAYADANWNRFAALGQTPSEAFPYLAATVAAQLGRLESPPHPVAVLRILLADGPVSETELFRRFQAKLGVYGYGDTQFRQLLAEARQMPSGSNQ